MSAADVGKIEAGRVVPYESQLRKLAKALGLRLQDPAVLLNAESSDE
jgi:ribosome-binding protein aMBF1 (putative translation factor)